MCMSLAPSETLLEIRSPVAHRLRCDIISAPDVVEFLRVLFISVARGVDAPPIDENAKLFRQLDNWTGNGN
jgi:hypothetical protein